MRKVCYCVGIRYIFENITIRRIYMKKFLISLLSLLMVLSLFGCSGKEEQKEPETPTETIEVTDQIGRTVTLEKPAEKVVSTYYLVTASILTLGLKERIVGIELKANSRQLYKLAAKEFLDLPGVGSGKEINIEAIAQLEPDVVFLPKKQKDAADALADLGIPSIVVDPESYDKFNELIGIIGTVCGVKDKADKLVAYYDSVLKEVSSLTEKSERPSVYIAGESSWLRTCGKDMYQTEMVDTAGGACVSEVLEGSSWTDVSVEQLLEWDPEYIFVVNYAEYSVEDLMKEESLKDLQAVKNGNVYVIPSKIEAWDYPQPSSVLGIYWMTSILHPEAIDAQRYINEAVKFYKTYYDIDITNEDL